MIEDISHYEVLDYIRGEGFFLKTKDTGIILLTGKKACYRWSHYEFFHYELILLVYATLVEPPLLYN